MKCYANTYGKVAKSDLQSAFTEERAITSSKQGNEVKKFTIKSGTWKFFRNFLGAMKRFFRKPPESAVMLAKKKKDSVLYDQETNTLFYRGFREKDGVIYEGAKPRWVIKQDNKSLYARTAKLTEKVDHALDL